jgi:hypothetical protein
MATSDALLFLQNDILYLQRHWRLGGRHFSERKKSRGRRSQYKIGTKIGIRDNCQNLSRCVSKSVILEEARGNHR